MRWTYCSCQKHGSTRLRHSLSCSMSPHLGTRLFMSSDLLTPADRLAVVDLACVSVSLYLSVNITWPTNFRRRRSSYSYCASVLDLQVTPVKFSHSLGQKSHSLSLTFLTQPGFRNPIWDHTNITRNGCSVSSHNHITCLTDPLGVT